MTNINEPWISLRRGGKFDVYTQMKEASQKKLCRVLLQVCDTPQKAKMAEEISIAQHLREKK